jgi:hypothetical protein
MRVYEILAEELPRPINEVVVSPTGQIRSAKRGESLYQFFRNRSLNNIAETNRRIGLAEAKFLPWSRALFYILGIGAPIYQLWAQLIDAEEMYMSNGVFKSAESEKNYEAHRQVAFQTFSGQMLIPLLARTLVRTAAATKFVRWLKTGMAIVSAPASAGVSIAVAATSEVALRSLEAFLLTERGRNILASDLIMPVVILPGMTLDAFARLVVKLYDHVEDKVTSAITGEPSKADQRAAQRVIAPPKVVDPELARQFPKSAVLPNPLIEKTGKQYKIGGVVVTDDDGYLDPRKVVYTQVSGTRAQIRRQGDPDPYDIIPKRPGVRYNPAGLS